MEGSVMMRNTIHIIQYFLDCFYDCRTFWSTFLTPLGGTVKAAAWSFDERVECRATIRYLQDRQTWQWGRGKFVSPLLLDYWSVRARHLVLSRNLLSEDSRSNSCWIWAKPGRNTRMAPSTSTNCGALSGSGTNSKTGQSFKKQTKPRIFHI